MDARYKGKHVLITGGMGFIGSNLAMALVMSGAQVTIADAMIPATAATCSISNRSAIRS